MIYWLQLYPINNFAPVKGAIADVYTENRKLVKSCLLGSIVIMSCFGTGVPRFLCVCTVRGVQGTAHFRANILLGTIVTNNVWLSKSYLFEHPSQMLLHGLSIT